jgi:hypothetical protein
VSPVPRARWRDELAQAQVPASLRPMKATLLALVPLMTTTGELYVWRDRMVKATGLPSRTLNHHLRQAGESGWLTRTVRGGNGRRSRYETALPCRSCEQRMAHNAGSCEQAARTQLPEVVSKFVAHPVSECERSERALLPDGAEGAPPPAPPGLASLRSSGGADEKQDPFFLRRSPERSEWARGSGGQAAPRLLSRSARPVNATHDGTRGRVGGVGGGNAERDRQKAIDDLALRIVEATNDAADPRPPTSLTVGPPA